MRIVSILTMVSVGVLFVVTGCGAPAKSGAAAAPATESPAKTVESLPAERAAMTAENNPTTLGGRGEPSLDDQFRPAAWVSLDGKEGQFVDTDGSPQVQWLIEEPVSTSPTFRVDAYAPLLGSPTGFRCIIQSMQDAPAVVYSYRADDGSFEVGREYSLVNPGSNFAIRNRMTGDDVSEIPPLAPGKYLMAAGIKNEETSKDALAVTYFTVAE